MKKEMKTIVAVMAMLLAFSGCGDSGGGAQTTNPTGVAVSGGSTGGNGSGSGQSQYGGSFDPASPGVTPYGVGINTIFPGGDIGLTFTKDSAGSVFANGGMTTNRDSGQLSCVLPAGDYEFLTEIPGQEKTMVHHYGGVTLSGTGPVAIKALLENSLSMQNKNGEWVMHALLKIIEINGTSCSNNEFTIYFGMPLAQ